MRSASVPPIIQRPTSSNSGVCYASPTAGPSQSSTPFVGVNVTGVSPGQIPGPASLSSGEAGAPASWTCLPCDSGYNNKFKVDETPLGYRLLDGARVPVTAPKREMPAPPKNRAPPPLPGRPSGAPPSGPPPSLPSRPPGAPPPGPPPALPRR